MNILETFFYIFDADTAKLVKGIDDADQKSEKLGVGIGKTDAAAGKLGASFMSMATAAGAAIAAVFSVGAIASMVSQVNESVDTLADNAAALDVNVSRLHAFEQANLLSDGAVGAFTDTLKTLNGEFNAIATKGTARALPFLKELGLSMDDIKAAAKDPLEGVLKMSDAFKKLTASEAAGLGKKLGMDQGTVNMLRRGRLELEDLLAAQISAGVVTEEQAAQFDEYNRQLLQTDFRYQELRRQLVTALIPALNWMLEKTQKVLSWVKDNKTFVIGALSATAAILTTVYLPAVLSAAAGTWAMVAPYVAVGVAALAFGAILGLIMDDLWNFQQGNDSVIGRLSEKWPIIGDSIRGIGLALAWLMAAVESAVLFIIDLLENGYEAALLNLAKRSETLVRDIAGQFPIIGEAFDAMSQGLSDSIMWLMDQWEGFLAAIKSGTAFIGALSPTLGLNIASGQAALRATSLPISSQTSNSISNSRKFTKSNSVKTGPITVNTQATDAEGVSRALTGELNKQLQFASNDIDDGVDR